jgi:hypothetical protein
LSKRQPCTGVQWCHQRKRSTPTPHQRVTNTPQARAPTRPATIPAAPNPSPSRAGGLTLHHRQLPRLVSFPGPWTAPALRGQRSCTAARYSNTADQHRPTTPATGRRPAQMTTIDRPAHSSGRRGRGFKSRHPDTLKRQVRGPPWGNQAWYFGVSGARGENFNSPHDRRSVSGA